jgi:hypothetical protein
MRNSTALARSGWYVGEPSRYCWLSMPWKETVSVAMKSKRAAAAVPLAPGRTIVPFGRPGSLGR